MTEYEIADYTAAIMSNFLSAITIYFSIITAYVIAAFIAGNRLSKLQISIVNCAFTIAVGTMGTLSYLLFNRFFEFAVRNQTPAETPLVDFGIPLGILIVTMYIRGLVFMWSTRRKTSSA